MNILHFESIDRPKQMLDNFADIAVNRHVPALTSTTHSHDFYEIIYVYEGEGTHNINGNSFKLEKGCVMILQPGDFHNYSSDTSMSLFHCMFNFDPLELLGFQFVITYPVIENLNPYFQLQIEQLFYLLESELITRSPLFHLATRNFLLDILILISRSSNTQLNLSPWKKVITYIVKNLKNVDFKEAVNIFGTSESYFCRAFKKEFSMSFKQYVLKIKIQHAKELCAETEKTISEIYEECGYNNNRTFFADFKKIVGMTPLQYRKSITQKNDT